MIAESHPLVGMTIATIFAAIFGIGGLLLIFISVSRTDWAAKARSQVHDGESSNRWRNPDEEPKPSSRASIFVFGAVFFVAGVALIFLVIHGSPFPQRPFIFAVSAPIVLTLLAGLWRGRPEDS
jgi:hypothetical protein